MLKEAVRTSLFRHPAFRIALVALGVGALLYALFSTWGELNYVAWEFRPLPIFAAFACLFAVDFGVAGLWVLTCRGMGGRIKMRQGVRIVLLSNLGKYLPGKVMHVVSQVMLASARGVPPAIGVTSILVELALSLMGACVVSLFSLSVLLEGYSSSLIWIAVLGIPVGLIVLHPFFLRRLLSIAARALPAARGQELPELARYPVILYLFAGYTLSWVMMAVAQYAVAASIVPVDLAYLATMGGVVAVSYLVGLLVPFAPAGLGAREGVTILMLSKFMPLPAAIAASIVYRIASITADACAAALAARL